MLTLSNRKSTGGIQLSIIRAQVKRIKDHGDCAGISVYYVLYDCIIATFNFALILSAAISREEGNFFMPEKPDLGGILGELSTLLE